MPIRMSNGDRDSNKEHTEAYLNLKPLKSLKDNFQIDIASWYVWYSYVEIEIVIVPVILYFPISPYLLGGVQSFFYFIYHTFVFLIFLTSCSSLFFYKVYKNTSKNSMELT